jgi:hypothetical protein
MTQDPLTTQQVAELIRLGEMHATNKAQVLWARLAFAVLGLVVLLAVFTFVWWNYGVHNATWVIVLLAAMGSFIGWGAMVSEWNDRTQERALRMVQTQMQTTAPTWNIDPREMRRQNALTLGTQDRQLIAAQNAPPTGFIFDDDDADIIEVKSS